MNVPIRARIALFGAGVVALTVVLFGILIYALVAQSLVSQQDTNLVRRGHAALGASELRANGGPFFSEDLRVFSNPFLEFTDTLGIPIRSSGLIDGQYPVIPLSALRQASAGNGLTTITVSDLTLRLYVQRFTIPNPPLSGFAVTGVPLSGLNQELDTLRLFLVLAALLSLVAALVASWLLAGRALRPLETMARTAEEIGNTQDLSRRLPAQSTDDEVGRLQQSFNEMLQQLEDAYRRLQEALAAQRRFVADASHELRTPLTTIRGNVGLLLKRDDITSEDRTSALRDIAGESERMSRMVQDLLTLARADAGQHLDKAPVELRPIVRDVSRQAQALAEDRQVDLDKDEDVTVEGNADALTQLLWILVDNAVKHTDRGGHIALGLQRQDGVASLRVRDDGTGIPPGDTERIFERFYQADASRSDEGTGLGLAIARWIAEEHGGRVNAVNNPDRGATFVVELPVAKS